MAGQSYAAIAAAAARAREENRDDADRAASLAEAEVCNLLASRYDPLADAQQRQPDGTIVCCDCNDPIRPERLAAQPSAVRCVGCQRDAESTWVRSRRVNQ